ncbi:ABC transporter permease [Infirmifilum lucidum]|uniref:ABC transporter permease n=1 Tax=Infirmifilum lucidum TaxID=2776706 RepID=A0A7L9FJC2_9CREN|nr:ABC transporter permease [Infirmifilum lucidum]QOJ78895.1 ABC transporter permease [Infirmifilum lucidum]
MVFRSLRSVWLVVYRDLSRFWKYRFWLAGQVGMNLADILIYALVFSNMINTQLIPDYFKFFTTGVIAIAAFASAFSIGREVGIEIRREYTHYLLGLPLSRGELVAGRILGGMLRGVVYQSSFVALAAVLVGTPDLFGWLLVLYTSFALSASMSGLAIAISSSTKDFNLQATFRALTYYILFFFSNVFYPRQVLELRFPGAVVEAIGYTPVSLAADIYRWAFRYNAAVDVAQRVVLLTAWTSAMLAIAAAVYLRNLTKQ